jgi:16S rRNA processing protein RimM
MDLVVGRIGRPHGIRGELTVEVRTDDPETRFAPGAVLRTEPAERGPVTVEEVRSRPGGLVVAFAGIADRTAAEALRGTVLVVDSESLPPLADAEEWYDHQLIGLAAVTADGDRLGELTEVVHAPGCDLLVVRDPDGREHLVPFVREIVPTVDVPGGRVVVTAPEGLFDL